MGARPVRPVPCRLEQRVDAHDGGVARVGRHPLGEVDDPLSAAVGVREHRQHQLASTLEPSGLHFVLDQLHLELQQSVFQRGLGALPGYDAFGLCGRVHEGGLRRRIRRRGPGGSDGAVGRLLPCVGWMRVEIPRVFRARSVRFR